MYKSWIDLNYLFDQILTFRYIARSQYWYNSCPSILKLYTLNSWLDELLPEYNSWIITYEITCKYRN